MSKADISIPNNLVFLGLSTRFVKKGHLAFPAPEKAKFMIKHLDNCSRLGLFFIFNHACWTIDCFVLRNTAGAEDSFKI